MFRDLVIVIIIIKSFPRYSSRISSPHNIIIPQEERIALHVCPRPEKFTRDPSVCATFDRIFDSGTFLLFTRNEDRRSYLELG